MESKYYRPDISDLFIGYELEYHEWSIDEGLCEPEFNFDRWVPTVIDKDYLIHLLKYGTGYTRTPYLTREQIEKDGWSFNKDNYGSLEFSNWDYEMSYRPVTRMLNIIKGGSKPPTELYYGKCPSINEFRKICKLVI